MVYLCIPFGFYSCDCFDSVVALFNPRICVVVCVHVCVYTFRDFYFFSFITLLA